MALLTSDEFYMISLHPTSHASWTGISPSVPAYITERIVTGATFPIYVSDSLSGTFSFLGGRATGFEDALLNTASAAFTKLSTTSSGDGVSWTWGISAAGTVFAYWPAEGMLRQYNNSEMTALKDFLP